MAEAPGQPQLALKLRQDMVYFSGAEGSPAYNKAREFSQKISTVGVDGRNKESWLSYWAQRGPLSMKVPMAQAHT